MPGTDKSPIPETLLELLACPACESRPPVTLTESQTHLQCGECQRMYPIDDGIAVMMVDSAVMPEEG